MAEEVQSTAAQEKVNIFETVPMGTTTTEVKQEESNAVLPVIVPEPAKTVIEPTTGLESDKTDEPTVVESVKSDTIKFANEKSEKVFNYLKEGKVDEALAIYNEEKLLSSVDKMTEEARIKLDLKYANPDLDDNDINGLFEETYERPEKPTLVEDPTTDEQDAYDKAIALWEKKNKTIDNKIARASKQATKNLSARTNELVMPDIQKVQKEPTQEEIAAWQKQREEVIQNIGNGLSQFGGFDTEYKDKSLQIPIKYTATEEDKTLLKPVLENFDIDSYFGKRWNNADGTLNGKRLAEDVYILERLPKIMQFVATESGNQRLAKHLAEQHNIDYSGGRHQPIEPNSAEKVKDDMQSFFFNAR